MTDEELAAIRARAEAATPGPWYRRVPAPGDVGYVATRDTAYQGNRGELLICTPDTPGMSKRRDIVFPEFVADATFIAHAREDVPALLAEVERLQAEVTRLRHASVGESLDQSTRYFTFLKNENAALRAENAALRQSSLNHELMASYADLEHGEHATWIDRNGVSHQVYNAWPETVTLALVSKARRAT